MFWNRRKLYRTKVNANVKGVLGFKATDPLVSPLLWFCCLV